MLYTKLMYMCLQFARRNMNVVLISSCYDDLVSVVSELRELLCCSKKLCVRLTFRDLWLCTAETLHNVVAYGIHADFSLGPKVFQEIHDVLHEFEVGILGMIVLVRQARRLC